MGPLGLLGRRPWLDFVSPVWWHNLLIGCHASRKLARDDDLATSSNWGCMINFQFAWSVIRHVPLCLWNIYKHRLVPPRHPIYESRMTHHHDHSHVHECACSKTGHLRRLQFIFAAIVLGLSAYTLSQFTGWSEVRFVVAAVIYLHNFSNW